MKHLRILITAMLIAWFAQVDAQTPISNLPTLTAPDSSADWIPIVHSGSTYKVTPGKLFFEFGGAGGGSTPWYLNGNTVGSEKFIGTLDNYAVPVRVNNAEVWSWETNGDIQRKGVLFSIDYSGIDINTSWGENALAAVSASSGVANTAVGYSSLNTVSTGSYNTAIGRNSGYTTNGTSSTYFGASSGMYSTGNNVVFIGGRSGTNGAGTEGITSGDGVTAVGALAGLKHTNGAISNSSYLGFSTVAEQSNEVVIGGITNSKFYFGVGRFGSDRVAITMQPTSAASGSNYYSNETDANGVNWTFGVSQATGTGTSGDMIWQYAPSGSSGTTLTTLTEGIRFKGTTGALTLNSTLGAFTPNVLTTTQRNALTASDGMLIYNSTDGEFNFREAGAWTTIGAGGGGGVTSVATTSPITGGTITTTGTIGIDNAAADGTTKGAASFTAADFNSSSGLISIDYTNGQKAAADGSTLGFATFTAADFNATTGLISLDYANGQEATAGQDGFLNSTDWSTFNSKVGTGVTTLSSLASIGTVTTGTWNATVIAGQYGGTGVANTGKTITLGGNLETSGANNVTFTTSGATNVTLPTSGTLVNSAVTTLSSLASIGTVTTGTWNATVIAGQYGGTGVANTGKTITLGGNLETSGANNVTLTTSGATNVTLPTTGTLATLAGTETFTNKSIVGTQLTGTSYTFAANNTGSTAAYTLQPYEDHSLATYSGTVSWNSTAPTSITSQQYSWSRIGNTVTLFFSIFYGTPGTTNTSAIITMPSDCPAPATFAGAGDAASEYIFPINGGRVEANMTGNPSAIRGGLRRNAANDGYEVALIFGSVSAAQCQFTISYRTQ